MHGFSVRESIHSCAGYEVLRGSALDHAMGKPLSAGRCNVGRCLCDRLGTERESARDTAARWKQDIAGHGVRVADKGRGKS